MLTLDLNREEFSARRRKDQDTLVEALRQVVTTAASATGGTHDWGPVVTEAERLFQREYRAETGTDYTGAFSRWRTDLEKVLNRASDDASDVSMVSLLVANYVLTTAVEQAAIDDPEDVFLEWVTMHDAAVRHSHKVTDGQVRPVGEKFDVDGTKMIGPGDVTAPIAEWAGCRCALRPTVPTGNFALRRLAGESWAAMGVTSEATARRVLAQIEADRAAPAEGVTHAGVAVQAEDTGRVLMIQRSMDPTDPPDVQGTWEFPGGTIEEGESPEEAAWREFCEETGLPVPEGKMAGDWTSPNGVYQGFHFLVPSEDVFEQLNPDVDAAHVDNPDDPGRRHPDVTAWFTVEQVSNLGPALRPEVAKMDWARFKRPGQESSMSSIAPEAPEAPAEAPVAAQRPDGLGVPWWGILAVEGEWTGDKRKFAENSLSNRPLPLPLTWQKMSQPGHDGNVTVAQMADMEMIDGQQVAWGGFLETVPEADETIGLLAEFGRFGVSVDADDAAIEVDEEYGGHVFTEARTSGACIVPIPALHQAGVQLGELPPALRKAIRKKRGQDVPDGENMPMPDPVPPADRTQVGTAPNYERVKPEDQKGTPPPDAKVPDEKMLKPDAPVPPGLEVPSGNPQDPKNQEDPKKRKPVAAGGMHAFAPQLQAMFDRAAEQFVDVAPGRTEDGPGWITNPEDTDRLRDYWVHGEGAAKIGWGTPGDFNRCRVEVGKYVLPQHINGYCANRHYDALGFWPGRPVSGDTMPLAAETLDIEDKTPAPALSLVAAGGFCAPSEWFKDPEFAKGDGRVIEVEPGVFGCPPHFGDDGRVYGHLSLWNACHLNSQFEGLCVTPPHSQTDYACFLNGGYVTLNDGTTVATGPITLGGGHAADGIGMRGALAHYDESGVAVADITVGEDEFGIWMSGWRRPGTTDEQWTAVRASALSPDWRELRGNLEMIAALAVNVGGFSFPRPRMGIHDGRQTSLVASGVIGPSQESKAAVEQHLAAEQINMDDLVARVAAEMASRDANAKRMAELRDLVGV